MRAHRLHEAAFDALRQGVKAIEYPIAVEGTQGRARAQSNKFDLAGVLQDC